jgi:Fe-S cluster assembly iron-binding protein IscA
MPLVSLQHADLSPKVATEVGNHLVELAAQAEEGQVVRVHITRGGAVGFDGHLVVAELRGEGEEQ